TEAALVSGICYLKLQIIGFWQNASAILHCAPADRYSLPRSSGRRSRVWSRAGAARFNGVALRYHSFTQLAGSLILDKTEGRIDALQEGETIVKRFASLLSSLFLGFSFFFVPASAHTPQQPPHQLFSESDLK